MRTPLLLALGFGILCAMSLPQWVPGWYNKAFGPEMWPNWALFAAAIWAGLVATRTLMSIEGQVKEMKAQTAATEGSVKAANDQIQMMKSKERARIAVDFSSTSNDNIDKDIWPVRLTLANLGSTHAFDALLLVAYIVTSSPNLPDIPPVKSRPIPSTIQADAEHIAEEIHPDVKIAEINPEEIWEERLFVHLRGAVVYKDVFDDPHGTDFHFVWQVRMKTIPGPSGRWDDFTLDFSSVWVRPNTQGNTAT